MSEAIVTPDYTIQKVDVYYVCIKHPENFELIDDYIGADSWGRSDDNILITASYLHERVYNLYEGDYEGPIDDVAVMLKKIVDYLDKKKFDGDVCIYTY